MPRLDRILLQGAWTTIAAAVELAFPLSVFALDVEVRDGVATITGAVGSEAAKRHAAALVLGSSEVDTVLNLLEVTAPLQPANHAEGNGSTQVAASLESVVRYPSIRLVGDAMPDTMVDIIVDLALEPDGVTEGGPHRIEDPPAGWSQLVVGVTLVSELLTFEDGDERGEIIVRRDMGSRKASFTARLSSAAREAESLRIDAVFSYQGRQSGFGRRRFPILATASGALVHASASGTSGTGDIRPGVAAADLTVNIWHGETQNRLWWLWDAPDAHALASGKCVALTGPPMDAEAFAREKLGPCPHLRPGRHASSLRGIGATIWEAVPREFRDFYGLMRAHKGSAFSIQILTDEPHVPWELMCPEAPDGGDDHLYLTHPVARWPLQTNRPISFGPGRIACFVPDYPDGSNLPWAQEEMRQLRDVHGALSLPATYAEFSKTLVGGLEGERISMLYFAGHGRRAAAGSAESGLGLEDGWFDLEAARDRRNGLGKKDGSFVVLNACKVGQQQAALGLLDGWPAALIANGFGGVLAPLWAVEDQVASSTVLALVARLAGGQKGLGEAMLEARREFRDASSTPYAYICHGDVMARMRA